MIKQLEQSLRKADFKCPMQGTKEFEHTLGLLYSQVPHSLKNSAKAMLIRLSDERHNGIFKKGTPRGYYHKVTAHHVRVKRVKPLTKYQKKGGVLKLEPIT